MLFYLPFLIVGVSSCFLRLCKNNNIYCDKTTKAHPCAER